MSDDAVSTSLRLARALEEAELPYAIGGAIAYGVWGIPRATVDVDLNVFVDEVRLGTAIDVLRAAGVALDPDAARAASANRGMFVGAVGEMKIDVFTPSIPFSWEALGTRVLVSFGDTSVYVLSAEAIAVFKMLFFRPKDLVDIERLIGTCEMLDVAYVRRWLVDMMGDDDDRIVKWDALVAQHRQQ